MNFFSKYGLFVFMIIIIAFANALFPIQGIAQVINVGIMVLGLIFSFVYWNIFYNPRSYKIFTVVYGVLLVTCLYQFSFGFLYNRLEDWLYLAAKFGISVIIVISILKAPKFYIYDAYKWLAYVLLVLYVLGYMSKETDALTHRFTFGFGNANTAGDLAAIMFSIFLYKEKDFSKVVRWFGIFFALVVIMVAGSRSSMLLLFLSFIFKYKFNYRLIVFFLAFLVAVFVVFPMLGIDLVAVDRLVNSYDPTSGKLLTNREGEQLAGIYMFKSKFFTGYGLTAYQIVDYSVLPRSMQDHVIFGTHNGYICAAKTYGILFLIPFLIIILGKPIKLFFRFFKSNDPDILLHLYVVCSILIITMAEDYLIGINALVTVLFFTSVSVLEYISYKLKHNRVRV